MKKIIGVIVIILLTYYALHSTPFLRHTCTNHINS